MRILYFGKLTDITGMSDETVDLPDVIRSTRDLRLWLEDRFANTGIFLQPTTRIALDGELLGDLETLGTPKEIALMPPVGGG